MDGAEGGRAVRWNPVCNLPARPMGANVANTKIERRNYYVTSISKTPQPFLQSMKL